MPVAFPPLKLEASSVQRVTRQDEPDALFFCQPVLNQGEIQIFIPTV